jgi:Flp pilus assembly protein TadG
MLPSRTRNRGQGLVEFALVAPLIVLLFLAIFDFGRAIYAYNTVSEAARNGGRVAIVNQNVADIQNVAASRAVALGIAPGSVGVTGESDCPKITCIYEIQVQYTFTAITPIISNIIGPITLSSTSTVPVESVCTGTPTPACPLP